MNNLTPQQEMQAVKAAFNRVFLHNDDGRRVLQALRQFAGMDDPGYFTDSDRTVFMAGHRSVILFIEQMAAEDRKLPETQEQESGQE